MRRRQQAHRRDDNHQLIVEALRAAGWVVVDTSQAGGGCPDVFAMKAGRIVPIEIKDGDKSPSRRALSSAEVEMHSKLAGAGVTVRVITSIDQAVGL